MFSHLEPDCFTHLMKLHQYPLATEWIKPRATEGLAPAVTGAQGPESSHLAVE